MRGDVVTNLGIESILHFFVFFLHFHSYFFLLSNAKNNDFFVIFFSIFFNLEMSQKYSFNQFSSYNTHVSVS